MLPIKYHRSIFAAATATCCALTSVAPAQAQDVKPPRIARIGLGGQLRPDYIGSDHVKHAPLFDLSTKRRSEYFEFEAPDESFGSPLVSFGNFEAGPALELVGSRKEKDVGAPVGKVGTTFEAGGFVQYNFGPSFRVRTEARKGIGGHRGWVGTASADYIARDGDRYLFSIGPRVMISDDRFQRAYFGVSPDVAAALDIPVHEPGGGPYAVGGAASLLFQLDRRWGVYTYARYERLIGDARSSPIVRNYGSPDQFSGGLALTYTFRLSS